MQGAPYAVGDRVELLLADGRRHATVSVVVRTGATDPQRRWRLLCRDAEDGTSIDVPVYCGDDGAGDRLGRGAASRTQLTGGAAT